MIDRQYCLFYTEKQDNNNIGSQKGKGEFYYGKFL